MDVISVLPLLIGVIMWYSVNMCTAWRVVMLHSSILFDYLWTRMFSPLVLVVLHPVFNGGFT